MNVIRQYRQMAEDLKTARRAISEQKGRLAVTQERLREDLQAARPVIERLTRPPRHPWGTELVLHLGRLPAQTQCCTHSVRPAVVDISESVSTTTPGETSGHSQTGSQRTENPEVLKLIADIRKSLLQDRWPATKVTAFTFRRRMIELGLVREYSTDSAIVRRTQKFLRDHVYVTIPEDLIPPQVRDGRRTGATRNPDEHVNSD
jgi:hypothetical protein